MYLQLQFSYKETSFSGICSCPPTNVGLTMNHKLSNYINYLTSSSHTTGSISFKSCYSDVILSVVWCSVTFFFYLGTAASCCCFHSRCWDQTTEYMCCKTNCYRKDAEMLSRAGLPGELIILCGFVTSSNCLHVTNIQLIAFWCKTKSDNPLKVCQCMEMDPLTCQLSSFHGFIHEVVTSPLKN